MKSTNRIATIVAAVAAALALSATPSSANFDKDELKCRKGLAKNFSKALATANKTIAGCHKGRNAAKISDSIDCNDLEDADSKGKYGKAAAKINAQAAKCIDSGIDDDLLREFPSCPEPCATETGVANPLTSYGDLATCLGCYAADLAGQFNAAAMGLPAAPMASKDDQKCHAAIAKGYGKYVSTALKDRSKCQATADKFGVCTLAESGCESADPKGKITAAAVKASAGIIKSCTGATLANLDSCSAADVPSLIACLLGEADGWLAAALPPHYETEPTVCPIAVISTIFAGTSAVGSPTETKLDAGWNGIGHGQDIADRYTLSVGVTCPNSTPPCGGCTIDGVIDAGSQYDAFTRCQEDLSIPCSNPFGTDPVCPGGQVCIHHLGPPLPTSASNTPTCVVNGLSADMSGSVEVDSAGSATTNLNLLSKVHLGLNLTKPCPICAGDAVPQDGVTDGTCEGGPRNGLACDVQGFDATFAPNEGLSLDCYPDAGANITGQGLALNLELTTGAVSLPFNTACDFPLGGESCACAVCSGNSTIACNSDIECTSVGAGTCTSNGGGAARRPHGCAGPVGTVCVDVGGDEGECPSGPDDMACDGVVRANGNGFILCANNGDCSSVDAACGDGSPGSCGNCTLTNTRTCFLDPIAATGTPDPVDPFAVTAFCTPPTNSSGVNEAVGLPGPTRARIQMHNDFTYF